MEEMHRLQRQVGARVALYSPTRLKDEFPWLNVDDVALGSYGLENEGWFDPWSLLQGMKQNAASNKIHFVQGGGNSYTYSFAVSFVLSVSVCLSVCLSFSLLSYSLTVCLSISLSLTMTWASLTITAPPPNHLFL